MSSTLCAHVDAHRVDADVLAALPAPTALGRYHRPIPHHEVVSALHDALAGASFVVERMQFALSPDNARLFGVLDLRAPSTTTPDMGWSYGFRSSTDSSLALKAVAGRRVFVCDNLALAGEMFALHHKATTGFNVVDAMRDSIDRFVAQQRALGDAIAEAQSTTLTDGDAKALFYTLFATKRLPLRLLPGVHHTYFEPEPTWTDCQPRSRWGAFNAITRVLQTVPALRRFPLTVAVGKIVGF